MSSEAEGESVVERNSLADDSPGESSRDPFASIAPRQAELATQPTNQHASTKEDDQGIERGQEDRQNDGDRIPREAIRHTTAKRDIALDAISSTLSGDAVDSVLGGVADTLLSDLISEPLMDDWPF